MTDTVYGGVWLSDRPLIAGEGGTWGEALLAVEIPSDLVEPYEWVDEDGTYREFLVPAAVINAHGHAGRLTENLEVEGDGPAQQ